MRQLKIKQQITQRAEASISRYFQEINKYPMVTPEEEVQLAERIREGDEVALEKLVLANLRFVISVAKQYQNQGLSFPDLINEGNLGLVKAARKFDEKRGFKFISYAVWWIRQAIIQALSDQTRIVRLPLNQVSSINRIRKAIPYLEQEFEREPTDVEIAGHLELSDAEVKIATEISQRQISFDMPLAADGDSDFSLYDVIRKDNFPAPDSNLIRESDSTNITRALSKLTRQESAIIVMSYGLFGNRVHSLGDMAGQYNLSSERIRQIRGESLVKLKKLLKGNYSFLEQ